MNVTILFRKVSVFLFKVQNFLSLLTLFLFFLSEFVVAKAITQLSVYFLVVFRER